MAASADELERFKLFVAGNEFKPLEGQSGVLVVGEMGSGKSTMISVQLGATYVTDEQGDLRLVHSQNWTPQTSDGWISKTLQVSPFRDPDSNLVFVDTAGLNENRGKVYKTWTSFSTCMVLSLLSALQGVVVMVSFSDAFDSRGEGFRKLAADLARIVGTGESSQPCYRSMIFMFTNAFRNGRALQMEQVATRLRSFLESERAAYEKELDYLYEIYPAVNLSLSAVTSTAVTSRDIKWTSVPASTKEDLHERQNSIAVAQAILQAHEQGRCMVSFLHDKASCEQQRKLMLSMIRNTIPISRLELDEILKMKVTNSQAVSKLISSVLTQEHEDWTLLSLVKRRERCMKQLIQVCDRDAKTVKCIREGDWRGFLHSLVSEKRREEQEFQLQLDKAKQEVRRLESSSEMCLFETFEVREAKSSGLFSWTAFGGGWARRSFEHEGDWFEQHSVEGRHFSVDESSTIRKAEGVLKMSFSSSHGHDLHLDVKTYRKEKDLPGTQERVNFLKQEIEDSKGKLDELCREVRLLAAIKEPRQLIDHVVQEKCDLERELTETQRQLQREVPQAPGLSESGVLEALGGLVPLLLRTPNGVPSDLAPAQRQSLLDFAKACEEVAACRQRLQGDDLLKGIAGEALTALELQAPEAQDRLAPVLNWPEQAQHVAKQWLRGQGKALSALQQGLETHPLPNGIAMLAVAHLMPSSAVGWWAQLVLHFLGLFLIVQVLVRNSSSLADAAQRWAAPLGLQTQLLLQQLPQELRETSTKMVQSLAERLDVQVRMDSKDLSEQQEGMFSRLLGLALYFLGR